MTVKNLIELLKDVPVPENTEVVIRQAKKDFPKPLPAAIIKIAGIEQSEDLSGKPFTRERYIILTDEI